MKTYTLWLIFTLGGVAEPPMNLGTVTGLNQCFSQANLEEGEIMDEYWPVELWCEDTDGNKHYRSE